MGSSTTNQQGTIKLWKLQVINIEDSQKYIFNYTSVIQSWLFQTLIYTLKHVRFYKSNSRITNIYSLLVDGNQNLRIILESKITSITLHKSLRYHDIHDLQFLSFKACFNLRPLTVCNRPISSSSLKDYKYKMLSLCNE